LVEGGEIIEPIGERVLGRVALEDIVDPFTGEILVKADEEIDERLVEKIENAGLEKVKIRSVLTCRSKRGFAPFAMGGTWPGGNWSTWGKPSGSSPPSPSGSREPS
jgi:DNA-directed RNA polymerase subunit beta'